jgi:hypothetical protein
MNGWLSDGQIWITKKFYNIETNCKHSKGRCGRLPFGDVYTCHGFF